MTPLLRLVPRAEVERVLAGVPDLPAALAIIADICRANALLAVKRAGSGHLGSTLSSLDVVTHLYGAELDTLRLGFGHPDRDVFFSSKGHDVPGLYAVLHAFGVLPAAQLLALRRIDGPCGHPDVRTPGIEANSGSLGMGIAKGRGIALGKRLAGRGGRVVVMTGDGELQEGQVWEALLAAARDRLGTLHVVVDRNRVQTDRLVSEVSDLGDLPAKLAAFGWHVSRCDGHDLRALAAVFASWRGIADRPKVLLADTLKGRGVSFMEHPADLAANRGRYRWHSGAPGDDDYRRAHDEVVARIDAALAARGLAPLALEDVAPDPSPAAAPTESLADAFGAALLELGGPRPEVVVLDADLAADCRFQAFADAHPARFFECGIAEQEMVSAAGGLALQGFLPVVGSFAAFLAARANEQIYANACEGRPIVYVCHYAGLVPAGPGHTHQSVRDVSLLAALPGVEILQPCNPAETRLALAHLLDRPAGPGVLRLFLGASPRVIALPPGYRLEPGRGAVLAAGEGAAIFASGPLLLHEALRAAEILRARGVAPRVVAMPWLSRADGAWLREAVAGCSAVVALDDHAPGGGLGDLLVNALAAAGLLAGRRFAKLGVEGVPAWGRPGEVLQHHGLDGAAVAERVASVLS